MENSTYRVSKRIYGKRLFNPQDPRDLKEALYFIKNGKWRDYCPFVETWPYTNVPDMVKTEIALRYLPTIIAQKSAKNVVKK